MSESISQVKLVVLGLSSLLIVLLIGGMLMKQEDRTLQNIPIRSIFEDYSQAEKIAKDWESDAEIVMVKIQLEYEFGLLKDHSNSLKFESLSNQDHFLIISCSQEGCESQLNQIKYISNLAVGLGPIPIDRIIVDSVDAFAIALKNIDIILDHDESYLSMLLARDFDTGDLYWHVVNNTTHGQGMNPYYTSINIDPFTGEAYDIQ